MFENLKEDYKTYNGKIFAPGFRVMVVYRFGRWRYKFKNSLVRKPLSMFYKFLFVRIINKTGIELPCEVVVGKGFRIDHHSGVVVSGYAQFGNSCVIRNGVTIGLKNVDVPKAPKIGNNVDIGAGAKILGDITIGDNVTVGANAVVLNNVPSNCLVVGIPARIIPRGKED